MISAGSTRARTTGGTVPHRATSSPTTAQTPGDAGRVEAGEGGPVPGPEVVAEPRRPGVGHGRVVGEDGHGVGHAERDRRADRRGRGAAAAHALAGGRTNAYRSEYGEQPAWTPTRRGRSVAYAMSPPFSTTPKRAPARDHGLDAGGRDRAGHGGHGPDAGLRPRPGPCAATTGPAWPGSYGSSAARKKGSRAATRSTSPRAARIAAFAAREVGLLLREEGGVGLAEVEALAEHQSWRERAPCGQASWHLPQRTHRPSSTTSCQSGSNAKTSCGQIEMQAPQSTHSSRS